MPDLRALQAPVYKFESPSGMVVVIGHLMRGATIASIRERSDPDSPLYHPEWVEFTYHIERHLSRWVPANYSKDTPLSYSASSALYEYPDGSQAWMALVVITPLTVGLSGKPVPFASGGIYFPLELRRETGGSIPIIGYTDDEGE